MKYKKEILRISIMLIALLWFSHLFGTNLPEKANEILRDVKYQSAKFKLENEQVRPHKDTREYQVGDQVSFWKWDLSVMPPLWIQCPSTCRAVGELSYIFVADDQWNLHINQANVDTAMMYLESKTLNTNEYGIVQMDTLSFGSIPDAIDNDPKFIVFYSALGSFGGSVFDGYFSVYNQVYEWQAQQMNPPGHSNECEMIYLSCHPYSPVSMTRLSVLSHELEHMIHWGMDVDEDTWVDEGCAEYAMYLFGYPDPIVSFPQNPNNNLIDWGQQFSDYIQTYLFMLYISDHFGGGPIIKQLVAEPANSIQGVDNTLLPLSNYDGFADNFAYWTAANFMDDVNIYNGEYGYYSIDLPDFSYQHYHTNFPASGNGTIEAWAAKYIKLVSDFPLLCSFIGSGNQYYKIKVLKIDNAGQSEVEDVEVDVNGNADFTITGDFDYFIVMVSNAGYSDASYSYQITEQTGIDYNGINKPSARVVLYQNFPNPFNPMTDIQYYIPDDTNVDLRIYNIKGELVKTLVNGRKSAGNHRVVWNGKNENGKSVGTGVYLYQLKLDNSSTIKKMLLLR